MSGWSAMRSASPGEPLLRSDDERGAAAVDTKWRSVCARLLPSDRQHATVHDADPLAVEPGQREAVEALVVGELRRTSDV